VAYILKAFNHCCHSVNKSDASELNLEGGGNTCSAISSTILVAPYPRRQYVVSYVNAMYYNAFKGIWQYIFLLFHCKELLKLYVNLIYRFCVTILFLEIF
jgi:hypothetical protein